MTASARSPSPPAPPAASTPELCIVVPALNEADNLRPLVEQVRRGVRDRGIRAQLIIVDDGSDDASPSILTQLAAEHDWVLPLRRQVRQGQSAAMAAGIAVASAPLIATLDADLQNDPAELPRMVELLHAQNADLVQGDRSAARRDNLVRRLGSAVGRFARLGLLGDTVRDTGCSARVLRARFAKQLPLQFKGMHRFIPVYTRILGGKVVEMPVVHRPRAAGVTKYGLGLFNRGFAGFFDLLTVRWMRSRQRDVSATPIARQGKA